MFAVSAHETRTPGMGGANRVDVGELLPELMDWETTERRGSWATGGSLIPILGIAGWGNLDRGVYPPHALRKSGKYRTYFVKSEKSEQRVKERD